MYFLFGERKRILRALFDIKHLDERGFLKTDRIKKIGKVLDLREFVEVEDDSAGFSFSGRFPVSWESYRPDSSLPDRENLFKEIESFINDSAGYSAAPLKKIGDLTVPVRLERKVAKELPAPEQKTLPDSFYGDDLIQAFYLRRPEEKNNSRPRAAEESGHGVIAADESFLIDGEDLIYQDDGAENADIKFFSGHKPTLWSFAALAVIVSLFLPLAGFVGRGIQKKESVLRQGGEGYEYLLKAKASVMGGDFSGAGEQFGFGLASFSGARNELGSLGTAAVAILGSLPGGGRLGAADAILEIGQSVANAGKKMSAAAILFSGRSDNLLQSFSGAENGEETVSFKEAVADLKIARDDIIRAAVLADGLDPKSFPPETGEALTNMKEKIPVLSLLVAQAADYGEAALEALGYNNPRTYLLLFENSSELRPNGGFPGTYGLVGLDAGRVSKILIDGIYNPDGQILEKTIPPQPLRGVTPTWGIRDSGWFFDYPTSARKAAWFYEKSGGPSVDGVLAVTSGFFLDLLRLTGPIYLTGYDLNITADNFLDEVQTEVEENYDKTLNNPKKILNDLAPLVIKKLENFSGEEKKNLSRILLKNLKEKNIILYFTDDRLRNIAAREGWDGSVAAKDGDYLAVVHSNVGGHKTDRFMNEVVKSSLRVENDGVMTGALTVKRTHNGGKTGRWWYDGENIDYLRIYLPSGARVTAASGFIAKDVKNLIDYDKNDFRIDYDLGVIENAARRDDKLNIDIFSESGKTVIGGWVKTAAGESSVVLLSYELPFRLSRGDVYEFYVQKQPGTNSRFHWSVTLPSDWRVKLKYPETLVEFGNQLAYSAVLNEDKIIGFLAE